MKKGLFTIITTILLILPMSKASFAEENKQVILISFDGMRNDLTKKYAKEGKLPHIKSLMKEGVSARHSRTITPSLTAPSHAAIATGARPHETGFVSNQWHAEGKKITNKDDAFKQKIDVSPLWKEAKKQGKTTATVVFPGATPEAGVQADYTIFYGETWAESDFEALSFIEASGWNYGGESYSPLQEAQIQIKLEKVEDAMFYFLAVDTTDDAIENYDTYILSDDKVVDENDVKHSAKEWGSKTVQVENGHVAGFHYMLKTEGNGLAGVKMYRTAVTSGSIDGPAGFAGEIHDKFGFFPVQDDTLAFEKGWLTRNEYEQVSTRFTEWVTDVSLFIKEKYQPDLLMFYAPQIDHEQHEFLLTDPRQPGFSKGKSERNQSYIEWSYKLADKIVGKTMASLDSNDQLFVVSDHGMEPAHTTVSPNKILLDAGIIKLTEDGKVDVKKSKAYAIASGSSANIYINLEDREKGGNQTKSEYKKTKKEIVKLLENYSIPLQKEKEAVEYYTDELFERFRKDELTSDFLRKTAKEIYQYAIKDEVHPFEKIIDTSGNSLADHENFGDLLVLTGEGFVVGQGHKKATEPAEELGTHGGDPDRPQLRPVFMAIGAGIKKGKIISSVTNLDVAPTIYRSLEIEAPEFVEGKSIGEIYSKKSD